MEKSPHFRAHTEEESENRERSRYLGRRCLRSQTTTFDALVKPLKDRKQMVTSLS